MKIKTNYVALSVPVIIAAIAIIFLYKHSQEQAVLSYLGIAETKVIHVASEIPGRIDSILVEKGEKVKKGQVLAIYEANVLDAKVGQAQGVLNSASGLVAKAKHGARVQEKEAAKSQYDMAKSQFEFAEKTYKRFQLLYADSIISTQEMDEMKFKFQAAQEQMKMAKSVFDMAEEGARQEDVAMALGKYEQAHAVYREAMAFYDELEMIAPVDAEISNQIAEEGEVVAAGYPVFTIQIPEKIYVILQIREDLMPEFEIGKIMKGYVAGINESHDFKISYIAPMAEFANWVPTNERGGFDLKTFEIHLHPVQQIENFRPGMSVRFEK